MIPAALDRLVRLGLIGRVVLLALVIGAALLVAAPLGSLRFGPMAWRSAVAAGITVFLASGVAAVVSDVARRAVEPALATVGAMMLRMGLALVACICVYFSGGELSAGGYVYFVLAFYLIVLPLETLLEVCRASKNVTAAQ